MGAGSPLCQFAPDALFIAWPIAPFSNSATIIRCKWLYDSGLTFSHYRGNVLAMAIAQSKLTAQGQISVPAEVRRRLELVPGSILEWDAEGDHVQVRKLGHHDSEAVHAALFETIGKPKPPSELRCILSFEKEGTAPPK